MNLIQYIAQTDPEGEIVSRKSKPWKNASNLYKEYSKINKLADSKVTDENKHQYISCLAGKGGKLETTAVWAGGLIKEATDLIKKLPSSDARKRYDGLEISLRIVPKISLIIGKACNTVWEIKVNVLIYLKESFPN